MVASSRKIGAGCLITPNGWRWIVDAHRGDGLCYLVQSDELLSAFLKLEETLL
jgi:hypothetical protein